MGTDIVDEAVGFGLFRRHVFDEMAPALIVRLVFDGGCQLLHIKSGVFAFPRYGNESKNKQMDDGWDLYL